MTSFRKSSMIVALTVGIITIVGFFWVILEDRSHHIGRLISVEEKTLRIEEMSESIQSIEFNLYNLLKSQGVKWEDPPSLLRKRLNKPN